VERRSAAVVPTALPPSACQPETLNPGPETLALLKKSNKIKLKLKRSP
jgi:hypothetical protein